MRNLLKKQTKRVALFIGIVLACSQPAAANLCDFEGAEVVANQELDTMRGGFTFDKLEISIGVIRDILVDGAWKMGSQLYIPNLTQKSSAQMVVTTSNPTNAQSSAATGATTVANDTTSTAAVINSQQTDIGTIVKNFGGTILVQNSKDGVTIQNNTTINAITNAPTVMRQMNMASRITQTLINASYR